MNTNDILQRMSILGAKEFTGATHPNEENVQIGQPLVKDAKVKARIIDEQAKGPKLYPAQYRRRKNSRRKIGHRQKYLAVEILEIATT